MQAWGSGQEAAYCSCKRSHRDKVKEDVSDAGSDNASSIERLLLTRRGLVACMSMSTMWGNWRRRFCKGEGTLLPGQTANSQYAAAFAAFGMARTAQTYLVTNILLLSYSTERMTSTRTGLTWRHLGILRPP